MGRWVEAREGPGDVGESKGLWVASGEVVNADVAYMACEAEDAGRLASAQPACGQLLVQLVNSELQRP